MSAVDNQSLFTPSWVTIFLRDETQRRIITTQKQQCNGRRHQDSSCGALIDSRHSCTPSIWGVDNKLINGHRSHAPQPEPCHKSGHASEAIDRPSIMCQIPAPPRPFPADLNRSILLCAPPASLSLAAALAPAP